MMIPVSACRSCQAPIVWAWTRRRARFPLDIEPILHIDYSGPPSAVYVLLSRPGGEGPLALSVRDVSEGVDLWRAGDLEGRVSHFATCPDADRHRKPREPGAALAERETA